MMERWGVYRGQEVVSPVAAGLGGWVVTVF